jgi:hypothetical protein
MGCDPSFFAVPARERSDAFAGRAETSIIVKPNEAIPS